MRRRVQRFLKGLVPLACVGLGACGAFETMQNRVAITQAPPGVAGAPPSGLVVPKSCPVYAPGGGDVDTPEAPFPPGVSIVCAVDDTGATYGIVDGDAPTAQLAIVPGNREIGLYVGFAMPSGSVPPGYELTGADPGMAAWAAPTNVQSPTDCCAEDHPEGRRPLTALALGPQGVLVTLGSFDDAPIQVAGFIDQASWVWRFYVNGSPSQQSLAP
jgi:hypothetical protein